MDEVFLLHERQNKANNINGLRFYHEIRWNLSSFRSIPRTNGKWATGRISLTPTAMMYPLSAHGWSPELHHSGFPWDGVAREAARTKNAHIWSPPLEHESTRKS